MRTLALAAECLNISLPTADRASRYARVWLDSAMSDDDPKKKQNDLTCFVPRRRMKG
jgi:hypothetical protein